MSAALSHCASHEGYRTQCELNITALLRLIAQQIPHHVPNYVELAHSLCATYSDVLVGSIFQNQGMGDV